VDARLHGHDGLGPDRGRKPALNCYLRNSLRYEQSLFDKKGGAASPRTLIANAIELFVR